MQELMEGSDSILAVGTLHGRGRGSGVDVEVDLAFVARLRDGLIRSFRTYTDRADALEAAGLSE
jgi:ketosteroid isomerase-like protein